MWGLSWGRSRVRRWGSRQELTRLREGPGPGLQLEEGLASHEGPSKETEGPPPKMQRHNRDWGEGL